MPYAIKFQEGGGRGDTGGGKEGQDRGEAREAEAEQRVKATDESAEQRVETRSKPEVELIRLKAVAMVESAKQRAETRWRPKVELMELLDQKVVQMRQMAVWAELVEHMVA